VTASARRIAVHAAAVFMAVASTPALACGFDDPASIGAARGYLNWWYPKSMQVGTAVWIAQHQGLIDPVEQPAALAGPIGAGHATHALRLWRDRLAGSTAGGTTPAFAIVLYGPMLWTRFEATGTAVDMTPHVAGPTPGDVVIVTDEPVIAALLDQRVTPQAARELGLMRLYGPAQAVQDMAAWLDRS
jgi:hypothetical protein